MGHDPTGEVGWQEPHIRTYYEMSKIVSVSLAFQLLAAIATFTLIIKATEPRHHTSSLAQHGQNNTCMFHILIDRCNLAIDLGLNTLDLLLNSFKVLGMVFQLRFQQLFYVARDSLRGRRQCSPPQALPVRVCAATTPFTEPSSNSSVFYIRLVAAASF